MPLCGKLINTRRGGNIPKLKKQKLVIFVDDLDRCLPENAVRLLEAIKNFLSVQQCLFVVAIDHDVIAEMIEKKYGLYRGYGSEYLMKIIHYFYELPKQDVRSFVGEIFESHDFSLDERDKIDIANFLQATVKEPRKIKHHVNQFVMRAFLADDDTMKGAERFGYERYGARTVLFVTYFLMRAFPEIFKGNVVKNLQALCAHCGSDHRSQSSFRNTLSFLTDQDLKSAENIVRLGDNSGGSKLTADILFKGYQYLSQKQAL